jgi:hypothetical protein
LQGRHQADEARAQERRAGNEGQGAPVEREDGVRRHLLRDGRLDARQRPSRQQRAGRAGDAREDQALGEELAHDGAARGAQ